MKKVLAIMIIMMLTLSMAVTVSAAEAELDLTKVWVDGSGENSNVLSDGDFPDVEITFEVVSKSAKDYSYAEYSDSSKIPDISVVKPAGSDKFVLSGDDSIEEIGIFTYVVREKSQDIAGATFNDKLYTIEIHRTYVPDGNNGYTDDIESSQIIVADEADSSKKVTEIKNIYKVSDLTIDKTVTGNLSDKEEEFKVKVSFESDIAVETAIDMPDGSKVELAQSPSGAKYSGEAVITISDNKGVVTVAGIPVGVTVYVEELDCDPYTLVGYTVDGSEEGTEQVSFVMTEENVAVVITNNYETEIDTGISLDSLPYILILAAVGGAAAFFFVRKRRNAMDID